jgi:hypothetical protein
MDVVFGSRASDIKPTLIHPRGPRAGLSSPPIVDLRKFCTYVDAQIGDRCEGQGFTGANWVRIGAQGKRASPRGLYVLARSREKMRRGDALKDVGCMTSDAYDAAVAVGLFPRDAADDDPSGVNTKLTWDEDAAATPVPAEYLEPIENGDTAPVDAGLAENSPNGFTMGVDDSYMLLTSTNPVWTGPKGPIRGLHRQVNVGRVLVANVPHYVAWNSWGSGWSEGGFSFIPCDVWDQFATEVVVHHGGVVLT